MLERFERQHHLSFSKALQDKICRTLSYRKKQPPGNLKISVSEVYPGVGAKLFFMECTMMHNGKRL